jgi:hypothetical protein
MVLREQLREFHLTGQGLEEWLPPEHKCIEPGAGGQRLLDLYASHLRESRLKMRVNVLEKARRAAAQLRDLLAIDAANRAGSASSAEIAASLGAEAGFFRADALERAFARESSASQSLHAERRTRCRATLEALELALRDAAAQPPSFVFHSGAALLAADGEARTCTDPCASALEFSQEHLQRWAHLVRTARIARLEVSGQFDVTHHTPAVPRFDWQTADAEELAAFTPVVVLEPAEKLASSSLASFAALLRSGYPVHILASWAGLRADPNACGAELGLLSVLHRNAVVVQSSMAWVDHLSAGLANVAASLRPAVVIAAEACAALSLPPYCFDPDRAGNLRDQFELGPDQPTELDATALLAEARGDIRVLPDLAWSDEQIEWKEYLDRFTQTPPLAIPYLPVAGAQGQPQRAVMTRALVYRIREHRRKTEMLMDLAGRAPVREFAGLDVAKREGAAEAIQQVLVLLAGATQPS